MTSEEERVRGEFRRRDDDPRYRALYSPASPAQLLAWQERERVTLRLLREAGVGDLRSRRILDVGCGPGGDLVRWLGHGATLRGLVGIDLEPARVARAGAAYPGLAVLVGNAAALPFRSESFDLVVQSTMFTSVLDPAVRQHAAAEMVRVVRRDGGHILWYDYWVNPLNPGARPIRLGEIRALFRGCRVRARRVTLAPPLARAVAPRSWALATLLGTLPCLRTHYLALITPDA